jgi:hypothetical protein
VIIGFTLAACTEMIFTELPIARRVRRIDDFGFNLGRTRHDTDGLRSQGPFRIAITQDRIGETDRSVQLAEYRPQIFRH